MADNLFGLRRELDRLNGRVGGGLRFHYGTKEQFPGPNEVYFIEDSSTGELKVRAKCHDKVRELRQVDPNLVVANDGVIRLGNITEGHYVDINPTTGHVSLCGNATMWQDFRVPGFSVRLAGSADPSLDVFIGGTRAYAFIDSADKEVYFSLQAPHHWKEGSTVYPHVHFAPNTNSTAPNTALRWKLESVIANMGDVYPGSTTTVSMDATIGSSDAKRHMVTNSLALTDTGCKISCIRYCRLYRDTSVANNYTDKVFLLDFDFHFEVDSFGSASITSK